jgi:hypothetical protein
MKNIQWLLNGNPVINHLTRKYLLEEKLSHNSGGFIDDYLGLYDQKNHQWGGGFYSPKWISTHYTLMELTYMEINGQHLFYQDAFKSLFHYLWQAYQQPKKQYLDMCIAGMLLQMACHVEVFDDDIKSLLDYILEFRMSDGGWNCMLLRSSHPKISSVHTTLSVLEGLDKYEGINHQYRMDDVKIAINSGIKCLLGRNLIYVKATNRPINQHIANHHYPPRWKYDYLRVLEFLAKRHYPLCDAMKPALEHLKGKLKHGRLSRGNQIAGRIHFKIETETYGYFNTLRAYKILKVYDLTLYQKIINMEIA